MKGRIGLVMVGVLGLVWLSGCVSTLDGRYRPGVPFVNDRLENLYERSVKECWTAAKDVLSHRGQIANEDYQRNTIEASIDKRHAWVRIQPVDQRVTRVTIQVRGPAGGPDMDLASQLRTEIAVRLATGTLAPATSR
jgi:hypothetical protein